MKTKNNIGYKTDPWGTPLRTERQQDLVSSMYNLYFLSDNQATIFWSNLLDMSNWTVMFC